jgi:acetolactate decarboxylase
VYDQVRHTFRPLPFAPGSPADFYVDTQTNRLFILQTLTHRLTVVDLPEIGRSSGQTDRVLPPPDCLFHAGVLTAFLGGLYDGHYPYSALKTHGDFGLGAPDKLDGEITIYGGSVFQTQHTGHTFEVADTAKTAYGFVHFFRPDQALPLTQPLGRRQVETLLDSLLPDANGMYALALEGTFRMVQTRAFPPVGEAPYAPLVTMLNKQRFFDFTQVPGVLVGYRLPALLGGVNIPGYHFHFVSLDRQGGGHVVAFTTQSVTVNIDSLRSYTVELPQTEAYKAFDSTKDRSAKMQSAERANTTAEKHDRGDRQRHGQLLSAIFTPYVLYFL